MVSYEKKQGPVITPHKKEGVARHVEETVQNLIDFNEAAAEILESSDNTLGKHFNSSAAGKYKKAGRQQQIDIATITHLASVRAFPEMIKAVEENAFIPQNPDASDTDLTYVMETPHWITDSTRALFAEISESTHPLNPLYKHLRTTRDIYIEAWEQWSKGSGRDRWPNKRGGSAEKLILKSLESNFGQSLDYFCTRALQHTIYQNAKAKPSELIKVTEDTADRISWVASTERHLGWTREWRQKEFETGYADAFPHGAKKLFLKPSTASDAEITALCNLGIMQDPEFCPYDLIRNGPVDKAANCAGNVFTRPTPSTHKLSRAFFEAMEFSPTNGDCFSGVSTVLAMGHYAFKSALLPSVTELRRRISQAPNADQ